MDSLIDGLHAFKHHVFPLKQELFQQLARGQQPVVLFITCSDSRINPNLITQTGPGELFIIRNAGNLIPAYNTSNGVEGATLEYAVTVLKVSMIVVCGQADCGAMKALLTPHKNTPAIEAWLKRCDAVKARVLAQYPEPERFEALNRENVLAQLDNIKTYPAVQERLSTGGLTLHGCVYEIETGEILTFDSQQGGFRSIDDLVAPQVLR